MPPMLDLSVGQCIWKLWFWFIHASHIRASESAPDTKTELNFGEGH